MHMYNHTNNKPRRRRTVPAVGTTSTSTPVTSPPPLAKQVAQDKPATQNLGPNPEDFALLLLENPATGERAVVALRKDEKEFANYLHPSGLRFVHEVSFNQLLAGADCGFSLYSW